LNVASKASKEKDVKYVVLSFDDARKDFYRNAFPILTSYNLPATINVITQFVGNRHTHIKGLESGNNECMNEQELIDCVKNGMELANHSSDHTNKFNSIIKGEKMLGSFEKRMECSPYVKSNVHGFASPHSFICDSNFAAFKQNLLDKKEVSYIRSGNQVRRDSFGYLIMYFLLYLTKSSELFFIYNKRNCIDIETVKQTRTKTDYFYPSITFNYTNTKSQIIYYIKKIPDNSACIFNFHSILKKREPGWKKDKWFNTVDDFADICYFLHKQKGLKVVTNSFLNEKIFEDSCL